MSRWAAATFVASKRTATVAAVGASAVVVGMGVVTVSHDSRTRAGALGVASPSTASDPAVAAALAERADEARGDGTEAVSRGASRPLLASVQAAVKSSAMGSGKQEESGAVTENVAPTDPRDIAMSMLKDYGWSNDQFSCLNEIYLRESNWDPSAENSSSGAFGIPQALPGDKMAAYGSDWQTNPATQLAWGLAYIKARYGSPCGAWGFWESHSWY